MVHIRSPRESVTFISKVPTVTDMGPRAWILVSVATFEAMQLRGMSKVATLTWMGSTLFPACLYT